MSGLRRAQVSVRMLPGADPLAPSAADTERTGGWISLDRTGVAVHRPTRLWQRVLLGVRKAGTRARG